MREAPRTWFGHFGHLAVALTSFVVALMSTTAYSLIFNGDDGRYTVFGSQLAAALTAGYFGCAMNTGAAGGNPPTEAIYWSDVIGVGSGADAGVLHDQLALRPNFFQADGVRAYGEFGKDKRLHYQTTRYFCRCLDRFCLHNRILLRHGGGDRCFMAIDAANPGHALSCGEFLLLADGMRAEAEARMPDLPFPQGVFVNDSTQGAALQDIPLENLGQVRENVRDFVRVLRDQGDRETSDFVSHRYSWHSVKEGDIGASAAGLEKLQALVWRTDINALNIEGDSALWLYRKSRKEGGIFATKGDTLLPAGIGMAGTSTPELNSQKLPTDFNKLLNNSLKYPGDQSPSFSAQAAQAAFRGLQCLDSGFVPEDVTALYKVVREDISCDGNALSNPLQSWQAGGPALEAELAFAARNAPTPSSMAEVGLAMLTALASIFGDPINSGTGFFISRLFRWNKKAKKGFKRGATGDTGKVVTGQGVGLEQAEWCTDWRRVKLLRVGLAIVIIVLPDLVGLSIIYMPLALILSNEFEVNSWRHTTYDGSVQAVDIEGNDSRIIITTPVVVWTEQESYILRELLPLTCVLFLITMVLHHQNVMRWAAVVYRSYTGNAPEGFPKTSSRLANGWFEPWLCGILQGVDSNLKWSHGDVLIELEKKYAPRNIRVRRSPGTARRVTSEPETPPFRV